MKELLKDFIIVLVSFVSFLILQGCCGLSFRDGMERVRNEAIINGYAFRDEITGRFKWNHQR